ncbi:MAG: hypothetical protein H6560_19100 [Lewinellaceae bacterium]|nr:hypothetical protein [Lewinellaceae bacterium]
MLRSLILILSLVPLALAGQPIEMSVSSRLANDPASTAILVSNQYGVLRYYKILEEELQEDFSVTVNRRLGEELSLTLVRAVEDNGFFAFENATYCGLSDGAHIDRVNEEEEEGARVFRQVEIFVDGVNAVEEVVATGPVAMEPIYRIIGGRLFVAFSAPPYNGMLLLFKVNEEENYRYFYTPLGEESLFELALPDLKTDLTEHRVNLPKDGEWKGSIQAYDGNSGQYFWVYNSDQMLRAAKEPFITAYIPGEVPPAQYELQLSSTGPDGFAYYGRYKTLPSQLEDFFFDPLFVENQSKAFRFKVTEEEVGQFYEVDYVYEAGRGIPDSRWKIFGAVSRPADVDFILPDIPEDLNALLPSLDRLLEPTTAVKRMLRCTQECDYDFSKKPYLLESKEWRMEHGVQARSQQTEF